MNNSESEWWNSLTQEQQDTVTEEHGKIASRLVANNHESMWKQYKQQCEEKGCPLPKELEENLHSVFNGGMLIGCHMGIFNTYVGIAEQMKKRADEQRIMAKATNKMSN